MEFFTTFIKFIWNEAKDINDAGTFFPVWGTCFGFQ